MSACYEQTVHERAKVNVCVLIKHTVHQTAGSDWWCMYALLCQQDGCFTAMYSLYKLGKESLGFLKKGFFHKSQNSLSCCMAGCTIQSQMRTHPLTVEHRKTR